MDVVDAEAASLQAVEIAAREIGRLGKQDKLTGFDAMDLERYAKICLAHDNHKLTWMAKLDPGKLPEELLRRVTKELAKDGKPPERPRRAATG